MNIHHLTSVFVLSLAVSACNNDPASGKAQATTTAAVPEAAPAPPPSGATSVVIDLTKDSGKVGFVGAKVSGKHEGSFADFSGKITLVDADPTKSQVAVSIAISSMQVEPPKLRGHLLSADFFDVEKFPTAEFTSTSIKEGGEGGKTHTVTGNLKLHGVDKSITFPATIVVDGASVKIDAEFAINRKDFAIVYPGMPDDLIEDNVLIQLALQAKKG